MNNATENLKAKPRRPFTKEEIGEVDTAQDMADLKLLQAQKAERKFLFQVISHKDGTRSEPFITSFDALHETLNAHRNDADFPAEDFLLLVSILEGEETIIPATPIIKISTFANIKNNQES